MLDFGSAARIDGTASARGGDSPRDRPQSVPWTAWRRRPPVFLGAHQRLLAVWDDRQPGADGPYSIGARPCGACDRPGRSETHGLFRQHDRLADAAVVSLLR